MSIPTNAPEVTKIRSSLLGCGMHKTLLTRSLTLLIVVWMCSGTRSAYVVSPNHTTHDATLIAPFIYLFIDFFTDKYMYVAILSILLLKKR